MISLVWLKAPALGAGDREFESHLTDHIRRYSMSCVITDEDGQTWREDKCVIIDEDGQTWRLHTLNFCTKTNTLYFIYKQVQQLPNTR